MKVADFLIRLSKQAKEYFNFYQQSECAVFGLVPKRISKRNNANALVAFAAREVGG